MKVLFDTDPGVDDALALIYLHQHPDVELVGITTVAGKGTLEAVTRNARYMCAYFGIDAPVARGAAVSLRAEAPSPPRHIHGKNALGDLDVPDDPAHPLDPRPAHRFIIDTIRAHPGQITLVAVAKLTNLALALQEDPEIASLVAEVIVMGGAFGVGGRSGNITPAAEANVFHDPHAADIVFTAEWPVTIIGLDVTLGFLLRDAYLADLRESGSKAGTFVWDVTRVYFEYYRERYGVDGIYGHDPLAAICATDPALFTFRGGAVRVVTEGPIAGHTVQKGDGVYPPSGWDGVRAQRVAVAVDAEAALARFADIIDRR
jgi:inosine-uridine nucleoside N-ribohydrolase